MRILEHSKHIDGDLEYLTVELHRNELANPQTIVENLVVALEKLKGGTPLVDIETAIEAKRVDDAIANNAAAAAGVGVHASAGEFIPTSENVQAGGEVEQVDGDVFERVPGANEQAALDKAAVDKMAADRAAKATESADKPAWGTPKSTWSSSNVAEVPADSGSKVVVVEPPASNSGF